MATLAVQHCSEGVRVPKRRKGLGNPPALPGLWFAESDLILPSYLANLPDLVLLITSTYLCT